MKQSIQDRLQQICGRHEEVGLLMGDPAVMADNNRFRELAREYAQLEPLVGSFKSWLSYNEALLDAREMLKDPELKEMAAEELSESENHIKRLEHELQILLLPKDPDDDNNIFLEIRAGTGGDEAALFAGDLFRMYNRYADNQGWKIEILSISHGEHGGYKEIISRVVGNAAFSRFKFESGTHRVQRVPETESQGRIHTSACTVAVLPEVDAINEVTINPSDLKIDTFRASGAGGQHVNTTDSAIRVTHLPTGIVVECQDERSQHKNKARALSLLRSRILEAEQSKQAAEQAETRRLQVGSGDRSQRVRTYNYPQGRITDHRINLTLYRLADILGGQLELLTEPLMQEQQAMDLADIGA